MGFERGGESSRMLRWSKGKRTDNGNEGRKEVEDVARRHQVA